METTTFIGWRNISRAARQRGKAMASIDDVTIEITPQVLLKAYACGIFPMAESAEDNALYWIEPERRGILPLDGVHVPKRLARTIRKGGFEVKIDNDFEAVIDGCAAPRAGRRSTWINGRIGASIASCSPWAIATRSRSGKTASWSAGFTACISAARFSARACSAEARREQDRARLSRGAAEIWRLQAARHAIRHRPSRQVRRDRGEPRRISAAARRRAGGGGRLGLRLGRLVGRRRRSALGGGAGCGQALRPAGGAAGSRRSGAGAGRRQALRHSHRWRGLGAGVLQLVSQTSKTGCSTALSPGLSANIQPVKMR